MKTMAATQTNIGKRGTLVVPASFRRFYGFKVGSPVVLEGTPEGVLIRPAAAVPVRVYSVADKAMFLLNTPPANPNTMPR